MAANRIDRGPELASWLAKCGRAEGASTLQARKESDPASTDAQYPMASTCQALPGLTNDAPDTSDVPFISHTAGVPSVFCHSMSALPSPLKSPVPSARHAGPGLNPAAAPAVSVVPSRNQMTGVPSVFCQRRSDLPSPLKSPAERTCQDGPGLAPTPEPATKLVPF